MRNLKYIRLALQKSGRLHRKSVELLEKCGITWENDRTLLTRCDEFPMEVMRVRDDDIPGFIHREVCELGIIGLNELEEQLGKVDEASSVRIYRNLGFGKCRLSLAMPKEQKFVGLSQLEGLRIATSYPHILQRFLENQALDATIVPISGSVELAPSTGMADAICDLVSTGSTLISNGLTEVATVMESEAVLAGRRNNLVPEHNKLLNRLLDRVDGVIKAQNSRYIMMNAPESALDQISQILPGMEKPTVLPLHNQGKVAVHAVAHEDVFWDTMEELKKVGATSILVVPIEKIID